MTEDRRLRVLRAIVQDYVETSEPVGSKSLLERHHLGVSAATVRNDMAALEEEGLIAAPHTSAGRIPTDAGYRVFVDRLSQIKPMTPAEQRAIGHFLEGAVDLDDVVDRTVRLLASLTRQVAVVQYPSLSRSSVRHVELVPIGGPRLLVVLITTTGRVEQRVVDAGCDLLDEAGEATLAALRTELNAATAGRTLADASTELAAVPDRVDPSRREIVRAVAAALEESLDEEREERVVLAGTANLVKSGGDFTASIAPVLEALEEHVVLLKLLGTVAEQGGTLAVRIGAENPYAGLRSTSMVTTGYGAGSDLVAGLGVVGPTRMDYAGAMASVRAVATYVSRILAD
ncbi:heat-inducible transcriptional repressor HrcA [Phycicoccus duodecadis]|uniref:Heat-inducible transcription repressor HrcA n=1 Tax=Phycicoccus duodecadis TaxID=173053 RepID=A0A2N3YMT8_9MICO|nr:heat-inducible transcriptional repressor HrcA [Phycicoccus duodecadis]PKW28181.1 heat-inducible transcription repressor HrcA [Phycicoccus duodecadis]